MKKILFFTYFLLVFSFMVFGQETLTITTYYPAPFGVYQRIITSTLGVGDNNTFVPGLDSSDAPDHVTNPGSVWISGSVGIGTTTAQNKIDVSGSAVIGSSYAGVNIAPSDGLLIEGNVGIGVTNPGANKLLISGGITNTAGGLIIETRSNNPSSPETGRIWLIH